jgi:hypothetical protein
MGVAGPNRVPSSSVRAASISAAPFLSCRRSRDSAAKRAATDLATEPRPRRSSRRRVRRSPAFPCGLSARHQMAVRQTSQPDSSCRHIRPCTQTLIQVHLCRRCAAPYPARAGCGGRSATPSTASRRTVQPRHAEGRRGAEARHRPLHPFAPVCMRPGAVGRQIAVLVGVEAVVPAPTAATSVSSWPRIRAAMT